jgi:hypothetical protein
MNSAVVTKPVKKSPRAKTNAYPFWSPRFWHGMRTGDWWRLMAAHGFRIHPIRWPMAFLISLIVPLNSLLGMLQRWQYGKLIERTRIEEPPVFIIGHWRSGTTLLHELLHLDSRFSSPTTYQCFAPHHFFYTEGLMKRFGSWLMPKQRPMDNMAAGWERPQEDEFALLTLGAPTPYVRVAFPNDPPPYNEFLDMQDAAPADVQRFERALMHFVQVLTLYTKKRLLLKSPPHTGRVELLARMFPGARFIHISRDPYSLFPSTVRLWQSLDEVQGLQMPRHQHLHEYVFDCLTRMYRGFEQQRAKLDPASICDVRYEDLVQNPAEEVARIYRELDLGDFRNVEDKLTTYLGEQKDYKTNQHQLDDDLKAEIRTRWAGYFERYGY